MWVLGTGRRWKHAADVCHAHVCQVFPAIPTKSKHRASAIRNNRRLLQLNAQTLTRGIQEAAPSGEAQEPGSAAPYAEHARVRSRPPNCSNTFCQACETRDALYSHDTSDDGARVAIRFRWKLRICIAFDGPAPRAVRLARTPLYSPTCQVQTVN